MKFKESFVITISREVGTGGRTIGRKLAERMDINFYDKELIHVLMKRFNLNAETIEQIKGEKKSWLSDFIRFVSPMPAASAILESDAKFGKESYSEVTSDDIYKAEAEILRALFRLPHPQGPSQREEHLHHGLEAEPYQADHGKAGRDRGGSCRYP